MIADIFPSLYQVNTRVWITELTKELGRAATLDDIPDTELDKYAANGFHWIWLLSVWQSGKAGRDVSRQSTEWRVEFQKALPDLTNEDIAGSGFAITKYKVSAALGGNTALSRIRKRIHERGMKLMLDFVPNHTGLDHEWTHKNPDFYVQADEWHLGTDPLNFTRINLEKGDIVLAHGRDPYFPGWPDTLQLNYGNPALQKAMLKELIGLSKLCDGVRCDMAMLIDPDVYEKTWGIKCRAFWPGAIKKVKSDNPDFCFMAEVYWDLEWKLMQQGFDYCYDKRLYDRLKEGQCNSLREHLYADMVYQSKLARFLENHDEARAASEFPDSKHEAAAIITYFSPGLRFFHSGQLTGKKMHISPHLVRGPVEHVNERLKIFYSKLLKILSIPVFHSGTWELLTCVEAWTGNLSNHNYIAFLWIDINSVKYLVVVNFSGYQSQCYVRLPYTELLDKSWLLRDLLSSKSFERDGNELYGQGFYVDEPAWKYYIFEVKTL